MNEYSPFANALKGLLDDTHYYTRPLWARTLDMPEALLAEWTTDKSVPQPGQLKTLIDFFRPRAWAKEHVQEFDRLAALPARHISPLGEHMEPTVAEFIKKAHTGFGHHLRPLEQQQKILSTGCGPA